MPPCRFEELDTDLACEWCLRYCVFARFVEARKDYMDRGWRFITNPRDVMQV